MAEIRIPVTAPGATEAGAQVRTFAKAVTEEGIAADKTTAANAKLGTARKSTGTAANEAASASERHSAALAKEVARLKILEEQAHITRLARKQLGESVDAGDVGALRRFSRSLPGGFGRELGRGVSEGVEGVQGSGLRGGLGLAGAGLAGGMIGFEILNKALEMSAEAAHEEMAARIQLTDSLREAQRHAGDLGLDAEAKYGAAIKKIRANGGSLEAATSLAIRIGDPTAVAGYADALQRFGPGKDMDAALNASSRISRLGGGSFESAMSKMNLQRLSRARAGGGIDQLVGEEMGDKESNAVLSPSKLLDMESNIGSVSTLDRLKTKIEMNRISKIGLAEGPLREQSASEANTGAAQMIGENQKTALSDADLSNQMAPNRFWEGGEGGGLGLGKFAHTAWNYYFSPGKGSSTRQLQNRADEKMEMAEKLRMLGTAAHEAADSMSGGSGNEAQPQTGSAP